MPTREIFWNIPNGTILYWLLIPLLLLVGYGIYRRYRLWRLGKPDNRLSNLWQRLRSFVVTGVVDGLIHLRFLRDPYPGLIHFLIFWGAVIFLVGAFIDFVTHYAVRGMVDGEVLHGIWGAPYLGLSFAVDVFGILALIGVIIATYRRYIQRPARLDNKPENAIALILLFVIILTGFLIEGLRIAYFTNNPVAYGEIYPGAIYDPSWDVWSPGGWVVAQMFLGVSDGALLSLHAGLWWFHVVLALGAIVYVALTFSSLSHIVVAPFNVLFRSMRPKGALAPIDIETAEVFGVANISDFTWKQLFDLDACTRCGRCQDNCPAYLSGKALSPKKLIQDLKTHWLGVAPALLRGKDGGRNPGLSMIGDVITEDVIWDCTTCRSCQEQCPVFIEHIDKIVDMRRNLVLEQAKMPDTAQMALTCLEQRGHPCRGTLCTRIDWIGLARGIDVKTMAEESDVDILFWVGCVGALMESNMRAIANMARLLRGAGIRFGILGPEETCCGDPARRMGNEYLYQMQVQRNIETFKQYSVKRIVTCCPHCFNTLKNEYPQFGGEFEVVHHTQLIAELLKGGRLRLSKGINKTIAYHDSCYLGRYNGIYREPRSILKAIPGAKVVELRPSGRKGFCCGAGGGHLWMEETGGTRINEMRTDHVIRSGADIVATACPYCLQMFEDGIKTRGREESIKALDIAELVSGAAD